MRSVRVYSGYFAQFLMSRMSYKWDFIASLVANGLAAVGGLLFVLFLIDGETVVTLKSWTLEEVLFIYGYSLIAMALFNFISMNLYQFGDRYIIQGQFDRVLLRPLNSLCQVLFESFNLEALGSLFVGLFVITYAGQELQFSMGVLDYLWIVVSAVSGAIILVSVFVILSSASFHFEDRLGIAPPVYSLIMFGRYPIPIYNQIVQFVLRWLIPFAFVSFYPATHFLDREGFEFFCYFTPAMSLICAMVAMVAWKFGVSRYSSTGN